MGHVVDEKGFPREPVGEVPPHEGQDKGSGLDLGRQHPVVFLEAQELDEQVGLVVDLPLELVGPGHRRVPQKALDAPPPAKGFAEKIVEGQGLVLRPGKEAHLGPVGRLVGDGPQLPPDPGGLLPVGGDGQLRGQGEAGGVLLPKVQGHPPGAAAFKDTAEQPRQAAVVAVH